jgi:hypothetical protein
MSLAVRPSALCEAPRCSALSLSVSVLTGEALVRRATVDQPRPWPEWCLPFYVLTGAGAVSFRARWTKRPPMDARCLRA